MKCLSIPNVRGIRSGIVAALREIVPC